MKTKLRDKLIACFLIAIALLAAWWGTMKPHVPIRPARPSTADAQNALRVKTVRPRRDTSYEIRVSQPAEVQPYYSIQLYAETAGTILRIEPDIGDEVERGQTIAQIRPIGSQATIAVVSPIDGVIVSRSVDPGTFVPNASVVPGAVPLVSIAKTDIVTVSMNVPDMFAPYVKTGMKARIRNPNATKGQWIDTKITRISPVARPGDRTRTVQVDLFNQMRSEFDELIRDTQAMGFEAFKSREPPEFPLNFSGDQQAELTPGLIHEMQITINELGQLPLLPSECIVSKSGKPYVFLVGSNGLEQVPVSVQFNDGRYCYLKPMGKYQGGEAESDWTGEELVVVDSQFDLKPGKPAISDPRNP